MTNWHDNRKFAGLLQRAARIAGERMEISQAVTEAFEARYGVTHSELDVTPLVDALEYGTGGASVECADKYMAEAGAPLIESNKDTTHD